MKIEDLKPAPYNPRRISPEALDGLRASIRELGDISGIVFNSRTGHLVAGHQRVEALKREFGEALVMDGEEIRTPRGDVFRVRVVDWDEAKERLANVAANNTEIQGTWDENISDLIGQIQVDFPDLSEEIRIPELEAVFDMEPVDAGEGPPRSTGQGDPVVQYNLIFDNQEQQSLWFSFLKKLRDQYQGETIAERLAVFLKGIL